MLYPQTSNYIDKYINSYMHTYKGRIIQQPYPFRLVIIVDGNQLVGSTCVRGPATGDSFSLLCIVLLSDVIYSFVMTFNRI